MDTLTRSCRALLLVVLTVAATGATGATAATGAPTATPAGATVRVSGTPRPGASLSVDGHGFLVPRISGCEVQVAEAERLRSSCTLEQGLVGVLTPEGEGPKAGTYVVRACVPTCADPWAGSGQAPLAVSYGGGTTPGGDPPVTDPPVTDPPVTIDLAEPAAPSVPARVVNPARAGAAGQAAPAVHAATGSAPAGRRVLVEPATAGPRDVVTVRMAVPAIGRGCVLAWDGVPAQRSCRADSDGDLAGRLTVPSDVEAGRHTVTACRPDCADPVGDTATVGVVLEVGQRFVVVPDLTRMRTTEATALLAPLDLGLQVRRGPRSGEITGQSPLSGARVPPGAVVEVTLSAAPSTHVLVEVPPLAGMKVPAARAALAPLGLGLAGSPDEAGIVDSQRPAAGQDVPKGTLVTVALMTPVSEAGAAAGTLGWLLGLAMAVAALLAGFAAGHLRSRWERRTRLPRAQLVPVPDLDPELRLHVTSPAPPTVSLRARPDDHPLVSMEPHR